MLSKAFGRVVSALGPTSDRPSSSADKSGQTPRPLQTPYDKNTIPVMNGNPPPGLQKGNGASSHVEAGADSKTYLPVQPHQIDHPDNGTTGPSLIPSKRKASPATANRSTKSAKVEALPTLAQFLNMADVVDLISDDEEPLSVSSESTLFEKQASGDKGTRTTSPSLNSPKNLSVATTEHPFQAPAESRNDLPGMKDNDLYSLFLKTGRKPPSETEPREDSPDMLFCPKKPESSLVLNQNVILATFSEDLAREDNPDVLFGSNKQRSSAFVSNIDPHTTPKRENNNLAKVKKYRERSELGAVDASRALREKALAKKKEPQSSPRVLLAPDAVAQRLAQEPGIPMQRKEAPVHRAMVGPINRSIEFSQVQNEDVYEPKDTPPDGNLEKPAPRGASSPRLDDGNTTQANLVQTPHPPNSAAITEPVSDDKGNKSAAGPNVIDLSDAACETGFSVIRKDISKLTSPHVTGWTANPPPSNDLDDKERSGKLMELIMKNQNARQHRAKLISHPIPIPDEYSTPRCKKPSHGTRVVEKPLDLDQLLGTNTNSAQRVAEAQRSRELTDADLFPPTSLSNWSINSPAAKGLLHRPEDDDAKTIKEKKLTWDAIAYAATASSGLVQKHGLSETTKKELKELRHYEERALAGENLGIANRRRIQDIKKNTKRREEGADSKLMSLAIESGRPPAPPTFSKQEAKQNKSVLEILLDVRQRAEQAAVHLQNLNLKNSDTKREARLAQERQQRKKKQQEKEALIRAKLRLYEDAEAQQQFTNGTESESEEARSERGASLESTSSIISDEDEGFIRVPRAAKQTHEAPAPTSRPPDGRPTQGGKGVSGRTPEILRQEGYKIRNPTDNRLVLLEAPKQTEDPTTRPTTSGKTVNLDLLRELMQIEAEDEEDPNDGEDEDLWMYQIHVTQYGSTSDNREITKDYIGSYYTLEEANKRASRAAMRIAHTPDELSFIDSRTTIQDGIFAHTITYASGRSLSVDIERVSVQVREAGLQPRNYRIPIKVWIVYQKVFHHPEPTDDDLFKEEARKEPRQITYGVFTVQRRANEVASACLVKVLTEDSAKADDEAYKASITMGARQYLRELENSGTLFMSTEEIPGMRGWKAKVWVEESLVQGPRN